MVTNPEHIKRYFEEIKDYIATIREEKGKSEETLKVIDQALGAAQDFVVTLILEKHIVYQHEVMEERAKPFSMQNENRIKLFTQKMEDAAKEAGTFVKQNKLDRWASRVQARLGRVADYKGEYKKAIRYYQKAIETADEDPEQKEEGIPRWLECQGFLAYSTLMSGKVAEGLAMSKRVYRKFDDTKEGKSLRRRDYPTWAIWKTGIPVRVGFWFIESGDGLSKKELLGWLKEAEGDLSVPKGSKRWIGKVDFGFRKDEIASIRREITKLK